GIAAAVIDILTGAPGPLAEAVQAFEGSGAASSIMAAPTARAEIVHMHARAHAHAARVFQRRERFRTFEKADRFVHRFSRPRSTHSLAEKLRVFLRGSAGEVHL